MNAITAAYYAAGEKLSIDLASPKQNGPLSYSVYTKLLLNSKR